MPGEVSRRDFLKRAAILGAGAAAASIGCAHRMIGSSGVATSPLAPRHVPPIDLAVARGDDAAQNCLAAVRSLGGFEKFVRTGDRVVIKPNPVGTNPPDRAVNTHPDMIEAVVRECLRAGAREVVVVSHDDVRSIQGNGTAAAVERAGGLVRALQERNQFRDVAIPRGRVLQTVGISTDVLDCDLFINMPIAKHHAGTRFTGTLKNLMGAVWDRNYYHQMDLHQCIAEAATVIRHDLVILDANHVLLTNGPVGPGQVLRARQVVAGIDPVAVDAYACRYLEFDPREIGHLQAAHALGVGEIDLGRLAIREFDA